MCFWKTWGCESEIYTHAPAGSTVKLACTLLEIIFLVMFLPFQVCRLEKIKWVQGPTHVEYQVTDRSNENMLVPYLSFSLWKNILSKAKITFLIQCQTMGVDPSIFLFFVLQPFDSFKLFISIKKQNVLHFTLKVSIDFWGLAII